MKKEYAICAGMFVAGAVAAYFLSAPAIRLFKSVFRQAQSSANS